MNNELAEKEKELEDKDKELEDLAGLLDRERKAHKEAKAAKDALEAEIESLSQALFEEVRTYRTSRPSYHVMTSFLLAFRLPPVPG